MKFSSFKVCKSLSVVFLIVCIITVNDVQKKGVLSSKLVLITKYVHIKSTTVYAPRRNWDSPNPFLASECSPPPRNRGEGAH